MQSSGQPQKKEPGHSKTRLNLNPQENLSTVRPVRHITPIMTDRSQVRHYGRDIGDSPFIESPANGVQSRRRGKLLNIADPPHRHRPQTPHGLFLNATKKPGLWPGSYFVCCATTCKLSNSRQIEAARSYRELEKAAKTI